MFLNARLAATLLLSTALPAAAQTLVDQQPMSGGGISRSSQLWQDPGPNGNDLDSDAVCWADFTLAAPAAINHIEWWGVGACERGFRIEIWPQDPGTVAYQPLGVFYYGGDHTVQPTARIVSTTHAISSGPGGISHYSLDLSSPISLSANDAANPRWFISVIGLTQQAYYTWNWSQRASGTGGSFRTYQWIRGLHRSMSLGEGRAMLLSAAQVQPPCGADFNHSGDVTVQDIFDYLAAYFAGVTNADINASGNVTVQDIFDYLGLYFVGC